MPAYNRHNEVIVLDSWPAEVDAHYYNIAQIALKKTSEPIRFKIPLLNHLDILVQDDAWIVVDRVLNSMPVACWTNFDTEERSGLHEPVSCEVRIYHFGARVVLQIALDAMAKILNEAATQQAGDDEDKVVSINKDKQK